MSPVQYICLAASSLLAGNAVWAQKAPSSELKAFSEQRINHQKTLGLTLGSFALANIAVGAIGTSQTSGETKYFHRMNVYWNVVNLGLAGAGLLGSRKRSAQPESLADAVRQHENMKQLLLINAGLDVAYVAGGAYLRARAESHLDNADQLRGYGKAVMAQGGFLLAFDLVNYFIFKNRGDQQERQLLSVGPSGIGLIIPIR